MEKDSMSIQNILDEINDDEYFVLYEKIGNTDYSFSLQK